MTDLIIIASGTCATCGHSQPCHDENTGCIAPSNEDVNVPCLCANIGNY